MTSVMAAFKTLACGAALVCGLTVLPVAAQPVSATDEMRVLQPLDEWEIQRLDDRCIARRSFGDSAAATVLELGRIDPWDGGFRTAITSDQFALVHGDFSVSWTPGGSVFTPDLPSYQPDEDGREWAIFPHGLWDTGLDDLDPEEMAAYFENERPRQFKQQIETFDIVGAFNADISLATGQMNDVFEEMNECMAAMLTARGVDPYDMERGDSRMAPTNMASMAERIYARLPRSIRRRGRASLVSFLLYLDETGEPTSCRMASLPVDGGFEDWGCNLLMRRGRYELRDGEEARPTFFKVSVFYRPE